MIKTVISITSIHKSTIIEKFVIVIKNSELDKNASATGSPNKQAIQPIQRKIQEKFGTSVT